MSSDNMLPSLRTDGYTWAKFKRIWHRDGYTERKRDGQTVRIPSPVQVWVIDRTSSGGHWEPGEKLYKELSEAAAAAETAAWLAPQEREAAAKAVKERKARETLKNLTSVPAGMLDPYAKARADRAARQAAEEREAAARRERDARVREEAARQHAHDLAEAAERARQEADRPCGRRRGRTSRRCSPAGPGLRAHGAPP